MVERFQAVSRWADAYDEAGAEADRAAVGDEVGEGGGGRGGDGVVDAVGAGGGDVNVGGGEDVVGEAAGEGGGGPDEMSEAMIALRALQAVRVVEEPVKGVAVAEHTMHIFCNMFVKVFQGQEGCYTEAMQENPRLAFRDWYWMVNMRAGVRAQKHPRFRYSAFDMWRRMLAGQSKKKFWQAGGVSIGEVQDMMMTQQGTNELVGKLTSFCKPAPGSEKSKSAQRGDLEAMVEQLASRGVYPTYWSTLQAPVVCWSGLNELLHRYEGTPIPGGESEDEKKARGVGVVCDGVGGGYGGRCAGSVWCVWRVCGVEVRMKKEAIDNPFVCAWCHGFWEGWRGRGRVVGGSISVEGF